MRRLIHWRHGLVADVLVIAALLLGFAAVKAETQTPPPDIVRANPDSEIIQYVKEGGMFSVLLTVLFFYRRDWKALADGVKEANIELVALVRDTARSNTSMDAAIRENSVITHRLARMLEATLSGGQYGRRMLDANGLTAPPSELIKP